MGYPPSGNYSQRRTTTPHTHVDSTPHSSSNSYARIDLQDRYHGPRGTQTRHKQSRRWTKQHHGRDTYELRPHNINFQSGRPLFSRRRLALIISALLVVALIALIAIGLHSCIHG